MSGDRQPSQPGRQKRRLATDVDAELADRVDAIRDQEGRSRSAILARAVAIGVAAMESAQPRAAAG